jgi:hypothetical protein
MLSFLELIKFTEKLAMDTTVQMWNNQNIKNTGQLFNFKKRTKTVVFKNIWPYLSHRYVMSRLSLQVFFLWRHVL